MCIQHTLQLWPEYQPCMLIISSPYWLDLNGRHPNNIHIWIPDMSSWQVRYLNSLCMLPVLMVYTAVIFILLFLTVVAANFILKVKFNYTLFTFKVMFKQNIQSGQLNWYWVRLGSKSSAVQIQLWMIIWQNKNFGLGRFCFTRTKITGLV